MPRWKYMQKSGFVKIFDITCQKHFELSGLGTMGLVRFGDFWLLFLIAYPYLEAFFNEHVVDIVQNADRYQASALAFLLPLCCTGRRGSGKTFAVEQLVAFLDWPVYFIDSHRVGSRYIHETSRKISEVFGQELVLSIIKANKDKGSNRVKFKKAGWSNEFLKTLINDF